MSQTPFLQGYENTTSGIPLYDTISTAASNAVGAEVLMFATPRSPTKGLHLTNMEQAGQLTGTRKFKVEAIRVVFNPDIYIADLVAMLQLYVLKFSVLDKVYALAPLHYFPAGGGIQGAVSHALDGDSSPATATSYAWNNGMPAPQSAFMFGGRGPTITPSSSFQVALLSSVGHTATAGSGGGTGIDVTVMLEGLLGREVN